MEPKIKRSARLARIISILKKRGRRVVFTNGCFDILHIGHIRYLKKARSLGDLLVIGLNSDKSVKALKGKGRPVNPQSDRAEVLASLYFVDYVTIFSERTPKRLIEQLRPDILVKGGDWKVKDIVGSDFVISHGGTVKSLPFVKGYSTTSLLKKIAK